MDDDRAAAGQEYTLESDDYLISKTDAQGNITFANPAFIRVSGFTKEELLGAPHNLVRHPDMPKAAFANLWSTLKEGRTWRGFVKNRRKDGRYYWVNATVSPILIEGRLAGYASVRVRISDSDKALAISTYAALKQGKVRGIYLKDGEIRRRGMSRIIQRFTRPSIAMRLGQVVAVSLLATTSVGLIGYQSISELNHSNQMLYDEGASGIAELQQLDQMVSSQMLELSSAAKALGSADPERVADRAEEKNAAIQQAWERFKADHDGEKVSQVTQSLEALMAQGLVPLAAAFRDNDIVEAYELTKNDALNRFDIPFHKSVNELIGRQVEAASQLNQLAREHFQQAIWLIGFSIVISGMVIIGAVWWLRRWLLTPLNEALALTEQIGLGNLTVDMDATGRDELSQLKQALGRMRKGLVGILHDVHHSSDVIAPVAREISEANHDFSARTEQQAASLEETSSGMEEMMATVQQNTENADHASKLAETSSVLVDQGASEVGDVVRTMEDINESSQRIADIIGIIDSIAFQTNLLALNASVEAARAGEQGRGFAVVAGEVRNLASRSASAAQDIKALIETSDDRVKTGTALVKKAGHTMEGITSSIRQVTQLIHEISDASKEQRDGIDQIRQAVVSLDHTTQQNAAMAEETLASSVSMTGQVDELNYAMSIFHIKGFQSTPITTSQKGNSRSSNAGTSKVPVAKYGEATVSH
ncbi:methyl-accepting chemotaxis protein [Larsenimonas rhizosphaerae]|uniref:methyl-accepting chemotaxis protein n=1 Tax=Larsenimonas rhizosphaerae TaxID=2944682 RepID=UPI0020346959|nr:methyl-accepting chemotaxis protein [Larsenimonas rhizosphaerae]MCM2130382.1 methyl-accepting chemotaxis protein [Larsenimonas rhizosphaerae]